MWSGMLNHPTIAPLDYPSERKGIRRRCKTNRRSYLCPLMSDGTRESTAPSQRGQLGRRRWEADATELKGVCETYSFDVALSWSPRMHV